MAGDPAVQSKGGLTQLRRHGSLSRTPRDRLRAPSTWQLPLRTGATIRAHECNNCREQHLPAVTAGSDPGRPVDVDADVALLAHLWVARVDA